MEQHSQLLVSVIIPVYNDSRRLKLCLQALANQTYASDRSEIIVVDNASTNESGSDNESDDIQNVARLFPQVIFTHESQPGSYAARNKGIETATGDVIAFTDSDCIPSPDWIEKGIKHLTSTPNCGIAAGKIEFFFQQPNAPNPVEIYDSIELLQQEEYVKQQWGATANLFTTPAVFANVGLFKADLKSGGDFEWGQRVATQGYAISYAADSRVSHPARSSLRELQQKIVRRLGGGYVLNDLTHNTQNTQSPNKRKFSRLSQKLFIKMRPPVRSAIRKSFLNRRVKRYRHKAVLFIIVFILHYTECVELFRLQMGGTPAR